jgi:hypothetical protein
VADVLDYRIDPDSEQLFQELQSAGGDFGYDSFIVTGLPQRPSELLADCSLP